MYQDRSILSKVVQEYEQEELADNLEDERSITKVARWLVALRSLVWYIHVHGLLLLILAIVMIDSFFEIICPFALFLLFPELVLPKIRYTTCVFSTSLLCLFFLCRPNKKETISHSDELGEGE